MRLLAKTLTAGLLLVFLFTSPSIAEIKSIKILSDNRPVILFEKFGFTHTGNVTVSVSAVSVTSSLSEPDPSRLGFFLLSEESLIQVLNQLQQNLNFCIIDSKFISLLFTFRDISQTSFIRSLPVAYSGEYSLFFANCIPESLVTMDVLTELFNINNGATKDYLSVGLTQLPSLYFILSLVYMCFLGFWISICFKNKRSIHRIHMLMTVMLATKVLSLILATVDKYLVKVTGIHHNGWNVLLYIFQFINVVLLFFVIILIGAGWPYLKPLLLKKEKIVLMIVITLEILANAASVMVEETGPYIKDWVTWNQAFLLVDFICCCAVIFNIVWSIRSFSRTGAKAARNLAPFRRFCVVVFGYLLVTRFGVFGLKVVVDYRHLWVCIATEEVAGLVLYLVVFYSFRPVVGDEYCVIGDEDGEYEAAAEMVKE